MPHDHTDPLPRRWRWISRAFRWYAVRYVRKHFHAVRLSLSGCIDPNFDGPLILVMNHPSWWDPMIGIVLARLFREREHFAAMETRAMSRYPMFRRFGFVPMETTGLRGAKEFLAAGEAVLSRPNHAFWVTPQGRFVDARERPLGLKPGIGFLATRSLDAVIVPMAIEYAFWNESAPEALVRIGEPMRIKDHPDRDGRTWTAEIEAAMTRNSDALLAEVVLRNPGRFRTLCKGRTGVGGIYDWWRRLKAWVRGRRFDPSHGENAP
jgi:1-acyl-sn-glycerol-3-phosphate acyltransferase